METCRARIRIRRRELERPVEPEAARRQYEFDAFVMGVEEDEKRVVSDRAPLRVALAELRAVQKHGQLRRGRPPVALRHPAPVGPEPPDIWKRSFAAAFEKGRAP